MTEEKEKNLQAILTVAHRDYESGLKARAQFKVSDSAVCQDLVQNTFMKTWNYLEKGGKIETMKAFLYHVLNNLIVDQYRKYKTTSLEVILEKGFEPAYEDDSRRLYDILDGQKALQLISHLPQKYQRVMQMRYVEDLTLEEMSRLTGLSKNAIAVQAHRGLELLKSLYK
jgi:RNA polymerase sigma-70 factor (ECF subfamily)